MSRKTTSLTSYKLAIELGSTSIGWAALNVLNDQIIGLRKMGTRVFSDGRDAKTKEPSAVTRRKARGIRRTRDRKKGRIHRLRMNLVKIGLFPRNPNEQKKLESLDPYILRTKALDGQLSPFELGRALMHLAQRRGFKSNRNSKKDDIETGPTKIACKKLEQQIMMAGARTLGEYLNNCDTKRVRRNNKGEYSIFPFRKMYVDEFSKIVAVQSSYYPNILTDEIIESIRDIIFAQRDLHKNQVGYCSFEYDNKQSRAASALPKVQEFHIYREVAKLDFERYCHDDAHLSLAEKTIVVNLLNTKSKLSFKAIRKILNVNSEQRFNLESDSCTELKGNDTTAKLSNAKAFGKQWLQYSTTEQTAITLRILGEENEDKLIDWLKEAYHLNQERAQYVSNIKLANGYDRLSLKAIEKILPFLKQGVAYSSACQAAGYHHSGHRTSNILGHLPYYGEVLPHRVIPTFGAAKDVHLPERYYGKVLNPTVHIVLNQLRKLVNSCIESWGHPESITIKIARDLKISAKGARILNARNTKDRSRVTIELEKLGVKNNFTNRMHYKIWEDSAADPNARCCPFTGKIIYQHEVFSTDFEIVHLIPFSKSFDDGHSNKVLASRSAIKAKGNRTPYEAFGTSPTINGTNYSWSDIQARATRLPPNKRVHFQPKATQGTTGKEDVIAHQLNDTHYLSRLTKEYLQHVCSPDRITIVSGQLTGMMRHKWGLETLWTESGKSRADYRLHAIDAFVVGCTTRNILQKISSAAKQLEDDNTNLKKRNQLLENMPLPFLNYFEEVQAAFNSMIVSHKPDHRYASCGVSSFRSDTMAKLHRETAYGLAQLNRCEEKSIYVSRKAVETLKSRKILETIVDDCIRARFLNATTGLKEGSKEFIAALTHEAESKEPKIHRVRCHIKRLSSMMIPIKDKKTGRPYKYYEGGGNAYTEIYMPLFGKEANIWQSETINHYAAHQPNILRQWKNNYPTAKLVMRLHNHDMVAYSEGGQTIYARVKKMTGGRIYLQPHYIAHENDSEHSWGALPRGMQSKNLRKIAVDMLGQIKDPYAQVNGG